MRHRGHKKAVVAVAHVMLRAVYHVLAVGTPYSDPGPDYYDQRHARRVTRRAIQLLERNPAKRAYSTYVSGETGNLAICKTQDQYWRVDSRMPTRILHPIALQTPARA